jgi:hypothetical protein
MALREAGVAVKVSFRQVGGFAPTFLGCELDTAALSTGDAAELERLVRDSGVRGLRDVRLPGAADVPTVSIEIADGAGTHAVSFHLPAVPEAVRPLLAFLLARSRDLLSDAR